MSRNRTLCSLLALIGFGAFVEPAGAQSQPNILMILVDDLGYGDLSSYGAKDLKTPSIDALMAAGVRMDRFYANCPVCSPTRAALLSGRYQDLVGVPGVIRTHDRASWGFLDPKAPLITDVLKTAGYRTALIGKWHLGLNSPNTPNERGFDHFHGWLGDMMDDYYQHMRHRIRYMRRQNELIKPKGHATDLFTQWSIDYLEQSRSDTKPFFLYLAYNAPHTPIQPPAEWLAKVKDREQGIGERRAKLVALIEHLDDGIGKVIAALKANGQYENTLILFTSDNGGQLNVGASNGPWRSGKTHVYDGGLRVPFCAVWPGKIQPGTNVAVRALTMDLYPTMAEAAGADFEHAIDGRSILPSLLGKTQTLAQRSEVFTWLQRGKKKALILGNWKIVLDRPKEQRRFELYNLEDDPQEATDLALANPDKLAELIKLMKAFDAKAEQVDWRRPSQSKK
jgi:arylsulfatase A-like enzyme